MMVRANRKTAGYPVTGNSGNKCFSLQSSIQHLFYNLRINRTKFNKNVNIKRKIKDGKYYSVNVGRRVSVSDV